MYLLRHCENVRLAGKARRGVFIWGGGFGMFDLRIDTDGLDEVARAHDEAGRQAPKIISRALNRTGDSAFTKVKRIVAKLMGVAQKIVAKATTKVRASPARLEYLMIGRGSPLPLRDFKARQTAKGVSAAPWGVRRVFPGTFLVKSIGNHAFKRLSAARLPIRKLWGPSVPKEMMDDAVFEALDHEIKTTLPRRILHELGRALRR